MPNLTELNRRLQRDYPRYRARWSDHTGTIKIEVKMGTGYWNTDPALFAKNPDLYIQTRDGYVEWGELTLGDRARCEHCTNTVKVPINEFKEVVCNWCEYSQPARAHFDLEGPGFIHHLNKLSRREANTRLHRSNNEGLFDAGMDRALDKALYGIKYDRMRMNNGSMVSVPQNFRKDL